MLLPRDDHASVQLQQFEKLAVCYFKPVHIDSIFFFKNENTRVCFNSLLIPMFFIYMFFFFFASGVHNN